MAGVQDMAGGNKERLRGGWVLPLRALEASEGSLGNPGTFKVHVCQRMRFVFCWLPMATV